MSKERTILLTGFLGTHPAESGNINPSGIVTERLDGTRIGGFHVEGVIVDASFEERPKLYEKLLQKRRLAVLALGVANCQGFILERRGQNRYNLDPSGSSEELGYGILKSDDQEYYINTSINYGSAYDALQRAHFPVKIDDDAGTLGCNAAAYSIYSLQEKHPSVAMLFSHVARNGACQETRIRTMNPYFDELGCADKAYARKWVEPGTPRYTLTNEQIQEGTTILLENLVRQALYSQAVLGQRFKKRPEVLQLT